MGNYIQDVITKREKSNVNKNYRKNTCHKYEISDSVIYCL